MKDTLGKLKELYAEKTKEAAKKLLAILKEKLCTQNDYEEDVDYAEEDGEQMSSSKLVAKIKELIQQIKKAVGEEREKLKKKLEEFRVKLCNYQMEDVEEDEGEFINDYEEDDGDEERGFGKFVSKAAKKGGKKASSIAGKFKKGLKKLKEKAKSCMKKGREFLKKAGMKVDILNCVEKTCNSCLSFMTKKMCMETRFLRTNKTTSVIFTFKILDKQLKEIRVNMGDVPRCVNVGSFVGKICMKLIEGRVKTSVGKVKCNFCMGILSETFGAGVKLCATYEDKKLKFKFSPKMFAGAMTEDGEMVEAGQGDEGEGVVLDADEFELDE
uniref:Venom redulysin 3 n=1 Tax=Ectomocoris sp. TaxID=3104572 RepID=A0AB38ZE61_9HEMI